MLILLGLLYQSGMSTPLPLVTTFKVGAYWINGSFGWVEFTQIQGAGLGSMVGLNPQCSHPVGTKKLNAHNNQRNAFSTQHKQKFTGLTKFSSCMCGWI